MHRRDDSVRNIEVKDEIRHAERFSMCGKKCLNPWSVAGQNTDSIVYTGVCLLPHTPHPAGAEGPAAQREPSGIFPAGTWGQGLGLCVLSSRPSCLSAPRDMAEIHKFTYLLCLESHRDWREGGPTWSL